MKLKWKEVSPFSGLGEDAPANFAGAGSSVDMNPTGRGRKLKNKDQEEDVDVITRQDVKIDGRSKAYRQHRERLEAQRERRAKLREKQKSKFVEEILYKY